jgi:hypothetical protein
LLINAHPSTWRVDDTDKLDFWNIPPQIYFA